MMTTADAIAPVSLRTGGKLCLWIHMQKIIITTLYNLFPEKFSL